MRVLVLSLALASVAVLSAGCARDSSTDRDAAVTRALPASFGGPQSMRSRSTPVDSLAPKTSAARKSDFARLPDRGELFAYDTPRAVRRSGAHTWYPVSLSEAHALASIAGGELVLQKPDGEKLRLHYERHEEHDNGNWTWVGRLADGSEAVLTFGENAAFGSIPDGENGLLRLTMGGGTAWLVSTDRSRRDGIRNAESDPRAPDYRLPPIAAAQRSTAAPVASAGIAAAPAAADDPVDVVLGYTAGLVNAYGGQSQAVTRLQYLMDLTNQAYVRSGVVGRVRLVATVQVDYTDSNANDTALEEVTGIRNGSSIPVPAGLQPLRNARDQYGGDLVSLVRPFRDPVQEGCGIAWLIGGGQVGIDQGDAPYGYSVVSDGSDGGFFCREESLAHELGHNMGQAHNIEESSGTGAHAYSYGYREASGGGFYTIMAYRQENSSQFAIPYFANPNVTYQGRPTGVAGSSDNARSLNQTMPIVNTFRAALAPRPWFGPRNDYNSDTKADILLSKNGVLCLWFMNAAELVSTSCPNNAGAGYRIAATADFNADGVSDILWTNGFNMQIWFGIGDGRLGISNVGGYDGTWTIGGATDMNGDGKADILMTKDGVLCIWQMNGGTLSSVVCPNSAGAGYRIAATSDFNGDGHSDILWTNGFTMQMWFGTAGGPIVIQSVGNYDGTWTPARAVDMNADGKSDILMTKNGTLCIWYMNAATLVTAICPNSAGANARIAMTADYNGDNLPDILWANGQQMQIWFGTGGGPFVIRSVGGYDGTWGVYQ